MTSEWKLVPVEPTSEMCRAANGLSTNRNRYAAMLAAAPKPPALGGEPPVIACAVFAKNGNIRCWSSDCTAVGLKASEDEGSPIIELVDRAHVTRLQADKELFRLAAEQLKAERDTFKAKNEKLEDDLNDSGELFTAQVRVVQGLHADIDALKDNLQECITEMQLALEDSAIRSAMTTVGRKRFMGLVQAWNARPVTTWAAPAANDGAQSTYVVEDHMTDPKPIKDGAQ